MLQVMAQTVFGLESGGEFLGRHLALRPHPASLPLWLGQLVQRPHVFRPPLSIPYHLFSCASSFLLWPLAPLCPRSCYATYFNSVSCELPTLRISRVAFPPDPRTLDFRPDKSWPPARRVGPKCGPNSEAQVDAQILDYNMGPKSKRKSGL